MEDYTLFIKEYNIIHLSSPYHCLSFLDGQKQFSAILAARLKSYQERYGEKVFPLGAEDFLTDMVAVQRKSDNQIVASFKYISFKTCLEFSIPFPLFHTLENRVNPEHIMEKVYKHVSALNEAGKEVGYIGSLTVSRFLDENRLERKFVKNLITTCLVHLPLEKKVDEILVTGTIPNGSSLYIEWLGYEKFYPEPVTVWDIGQTTAYVLHWKKFSEAALETANSFHHFWRDRIFVTKQNVLEQIKKAV